MGKSSLQRKSELEDEKYKHYQAKRKLVPIIFILGTTSILPTLWGDFVFDDGEAIVKNTDVTSVALRRKGGREWDQIVKVFKHDFWGVDVTHKLSHKSYRPLTTLSYRLDYHFWGRNPFPFHLFDLLLHGLNCVLVFIFLNKCIQHRISSSEPIISFSYRKQIGYSAPCGKCRRLAFWGALLFSVHPVHVEPLGAVVGRADLLAAFVFLFAFCCVTNAGKKHAIMQSGLIGGYKGAVWISLCSMFGALFKETAIVLPVLVIVLDLYVRKTNNILVGRGKTFIPQYILMLAAASSFVLWRLWLQDGAPVFQPYDNPPAFAATFFSRVVNIVYIWLLNVVLLLCPIWLCYDWSMGCVQLIENWWDVRLLFVAIFVCICFRLAYLAWKNRLVAISALIFGSTFLPSSNLLFTVGFVLAERNLYLSSIGYCLFLAYVLHRTDQPRILSFVVGLFYMRSVQRSMDWGNQGSLFVSALHVCPNNAKVHYNLGTMYGDISDHVTAERYYRKAISLRSDYYQAMNNLGNLLRVNGRLEEAERWLDRAVTIKSDFAAAWMNLGIVLSARNHTAAMICYENALKFRKNYADCEYNLGNLYLDMGNKEDALNAWQRAVAIKPAHSQAWINSVILQEHNGELEEAKATATVALKYLRTEDTLHFILGNILGKLGEFEWAKASFETAIKLRLHENKAVPPKYFSNLGVLYHRWGKKEQAIRAYQHALKIEPHSSTTQKNLEMLMKSVMEQEPPT